MKSVDWWRNADGTWTGRVYSLTFTGTYLEVMAWLRSQCPGEL
jgi:hypothetical protein